MRVLGRRHAERLEKLDVLGRVGKMVLAADDVGDAHLDVVHDVDEVEDPRAIGPADRHVGLQVAEGVDGLGTVHHDVPAHEVVHDDLLARQLETDGSFILVDCAGGLELFEVSEVDRVAFALEIRSVVAADAGAFVPVETEPFQAVIDDLHGLDGVARLVGVLDAQDERATGVPGVEPVEQRGARPADVQEAGGRGGETDTDGRRTHKRETDDRLDRQLGAESASLQSEAESAADYADFRRRQTEPRRRSCLSLFLKSAQICVICGYDSF